MRLSAIAEELIARGEKVTFIGHVAALPWLASRINSQGFSQILQSSTEYLPDPATDVLILDSYTLSVDDDFIKSSNWKGIVTISDAMTPPYKASMIFRPGISKDRGPDLDIKYFSGPNYIPFRKSIKKFEKSPSNFEVLEILVVGGGSDPFEFTKAICLALRSIQGNFQVRIFTKNLLLAELDTRFTVFEIGPELDVYATSAELVFTTASTASLEFIAREVAVGIGCATDNQEEYYESLASAGVAVPIGIFSNGEWNLDEHKIAEMVHSAQLREAIMQRASGSFDLQGTSRIVDEILKL
jgi:spore coat polysaccharide biosynthesis predicted glycosyltransferase SpsG